MFTDAPIRAQNEFLTPSAMWEPTWCEIGDFAGFLQR
jgi:hypothetical protein